MYRNQKRRKIEINSVCGLSIIGSTTAKQLNFNSDRRSGYSPINTLYIVTELHGDLEFDLSEIKNIRFSIVNEEEDIVVKSN